MFNLLKIKIMAILSRGFDQTNLSGSVGGVTYRRVDGRTIASQKVPVKSTARKTRAVMLQRMKWANLVALWRALNVRGWHPSFPKEDVGVTDFQMFMSANLEGAGIYLDKGMQRSGATVAAPTKITEGTLPTIAVEFETDIPSTDINMGTLTIGQSTTLKAFSDAVLLNNQGWQNGDKLTLIIMRQSISAPSVPIVSVTALQVQLDNSDAAGTTMLSDIVDVTLLSVIDGYLGIAGTVIGAFAAVQSRRLSDGKTAVSRQSLVANNRTILPQFTGNAAFEKAAESYGGIASDDYLTPTSEEYEATVINP